MKLKHQANVKMQAVNARASQRAIFAAVTAKIRRKTVQITIANAVIHNAANRKKHVLFKNALFYC